MRRPLDDLWPLAGPRPPEPGEIAVEGADPVLPTHFAIGEAAAAALAAGGLAAARIGEQRGLPPQRIRVDVPAATASLLGFALQRATGGTRASPASVERAFPAMTNLFRTRDGRWIHLHGGFPQLRDGLMSLLGCEDEIASIQSAVERHDAFALEDAIAARGLCAAVARSAREWEAHAQGAALAAAPLVEVRRIGEAEPRRLPTAERPLDDVRVLDLTRVLAGPTCGRTLAAHGAEVLRIDGPKLPHIPPFVLDTSHGKRSAFLDLRDPAGRERLDDLLSRCDVFSQSYRAGALAALGLSPEELAARRPGIVLVSVNCYGHEGPWRERRGWEQLAQSASGIALEQGGERPALLPAAATDYTTGNLAALGAMSALRRRAEEGGSWHVRVSLARTARWLLELPRVDGEPSGWSREQLEPYCQSTPWAGGRLHHLGPVLRMSGSPPRWTRPTGDLGRHEARWENRPGRERSP